MHSCTLAAICRRDEVSYRYMGTLGDANLIFSLSLPFRMGIKSERKDFVARNFYILRVSFSLEGWSRRRKHPMLQKRCVLFTWRANMDIYRVSSCYLLADIFFLYLSMKFGDFKVKYILVKISFSIFSVWDYLFF